MRLAMAVAVLLAGCAPAFDVTGLEWTKPDTSTHQVTLDETNCARAAYGSGSTPDLVLGGLLDVGRIIVENGAQAHTYDSCMRKLGYRARSA